MTRTELMSSLGPGDVANPAGLRKQFFLHRHIASVVVVDTQIQHRYFHEWLKLMDARDLLSLVPCIWG